MRLIQFISADGERRVGLLENGGTVVRCLTKASHVHELALDEGRRNVTLETLNQDRLGQQSADYEQIVASKLPRCKKYELP